MSIQNWLELLHAFGQMANVWHNSVGRWKCQYFMNTEPYGPRGRCYGTVLERPAEGSVDPPDSPTGQTVIVTISWSSFWQRSADDQGLSPHGSDTANDMTICQVNKPLWSDQNTFFVQNVMSLVIIITMIIIILIIITATWMLRHP